MNKAGIYFPAFSYCEMTIHIFNPDTDYALALGRKHYSPPSRIISLRKSMALFPAKFASPGDAILLIDDVEDKQLQESPYFEISVNKAIDIIKLNQIADYISQYESIHDNLTLQPWGWNHTILRTLLNAGVEQKYLKTEDRIDTIRELSHRRTTIPFQTILSKDLGDITVIPAKEFNSTTDAMGFLKSNPGAYFKAPWSSSGRGVINTTFMKTDEIISWVNGCIKRQGSVIGEIGRNRTGDFATEWFCKGGEARFLGLSLFRTTREGRYKGNVKGSQEFLWQSISGYTSLWNHNVIDAQKNAIDSIISPLYEGPVGIDMFSTVEGDLNPCVEINLRMTMGLATLWEN